MDMALRPMSTSQVLDRTFYLYRKHFVLFAGIAVITPALKLIAMLIQLRVFGPLTMPQQPDAITPQFMQAFMIRSAIAFVVAAGIYVLGTAVASSATAYAVSMVHLGKTTTIVEAYTRVKPILGRIIGLLLLLFLFILGPLFGGYILVIVVAVGGALLGGSSGGGAAVTMLLAVLLLLAFIGGAIFWILFATCRYALAVPACIVENLPATYALRRSSFLTKGAKWGILGILLLTWLMGFILTGVLQAPVLFANSTAFFSGKGVVSAGAMIWSYIANFLGGTLAGPIATVALALVYYDQRVRKEAFDLQLMMEAIGQTAPAIPTSPAAAVATPPPPPPIG